LKGTCKINNLSTNTPVIYLLNKRKRARSIARDGNVALTDSLLKLSHVMELVHMKKSTIYKRIKNKQFPPPVRISDRLVAWRASDIAAFINNLKPIGDI